MDLSDFLSTHSYDILPTFDGVLQRFKGLSRKSKSGWFVGFDNGIGKALIIGDWVTNDSNLWLSKRGLLKDETLKKKIEQAKLDQINLRLETQTFAAADAEKYLTNNATTLIANDFKYIKNKKIVNNSILYEDQFGLNIAIPICDVEGKITSLQKIYDDGFKSFIPGGKITGCFYTIGSINLDEVVYLCEGYATAVSIRMATQKTVIVCFFAGNISKVCAELLKKYPKIEMVICADNDQFNKENTGLIAAQNCKIKYSVNFVYPSFPDGSKDSRPTDFNDLHCLSGLDEVKKQVEKVSCSTIQKTDEYLQYKNLFEVLYPTAKKCILTSYSTYQNNDDRKSILNEIKSIRAYAQMSGLNKNKVDDYLDVWINDIPSQLLLNIPKHDGTDHIENILNHVIIKNIDHKYFVDLMKGWFAGIFHRLNDNFYQNKMIILKGEQGIGKDTFVESLFKDFRPYFTSTGIYEKEIENFQTMSRHLVLNLSEFDRTVKMQVSQLKNIITAAEATFRQPYAREPATFKFRTSFISTVNIDDIFRDETGNRRFMFFDVEKINWNYPKDLSLKIMAQALDLYENEFEPSIESINAMDIIIRSMTPDNWEEYAIELWNCRFDSIIKDWNDENGNPVCRLNFSQIALLPFEIAKTLGVKQKAVQGLIKKRFQIRDGSGRFYYSDASRSKEISRLTGSSGQMTAIKNFAVTN